MKQFSAKTLLMTVFILISVLLFFEGCATLLEGVTDLNYLRLYPGQPLPKDEIAVLTHMNPYSQNVVIRAVDGKKLKVQGHIIELLPGKHEICAKYASSSGYSKECATVTFNAIAGSVYVLFPLLSEDRSHWSPKIAVASQNMDKYRNAIQAVNNYVPNRRSDNEYYTKGMQVLGNKN